MTKGIYCYVDTQHNDEIVYIGKDSNIDKRQRDKAHKTKANYDRQKINQIIQNNLSRYNYNVLWEVDDCSDNHLNQIEIYYITKYNPKFNFTDGGDGISGYKHTDETKRKMSEKKKGENNPKYWQGKTFSDEHKKKISQNHYDISGENNPMYGKDTSGKNNHFYNHKHTDEAKKQMKIAHGGHKYTIIKNGTQNNKQVYAIRDLNNKYIKQSNNINKLKEYLFKKVLKKEISFNDLSKSLKQEYLSFYHSINNN